MTTLSKTRLFNSCLLLGGMILYLLSTVITVSAQEVLRLHSCDEVSDISQEECEILQEIRDSHADTWWEIDARFNEGCNIEHRLDNLNSSHWFYSSSACSWGGVVCSESSSVVQLAVRSCTDSTLPESVGELPNLTHLFIEDNNRLSTLPQSISNLSNLTHLSVNGNLELLQLPDSIGNLSNLTTLSIEDNTNLLTLPETIGDLSNLNHLTIQDNLSLTRLPETVGTLSNLQTLIIESNPLRDIPNSVIESNYPYIQTYTVQAESTTTTISTVYADYIGYRRDYDELLYVVIYNVRVPVPLTIEYEQFSCANPTNIQFGLRGPQITDNPNWDYDEGIILAGTLVLTTGYRVMLDTEIVDDRYIVTLPTPWDDIRGFYSEDELFVTYDCSDGEQHVEVLAAIDWLDPTNVHLTQTSLQTSSIRDTSVILAALLMLFASTSAVAHSKMRR